MPGMTVEFSRTYELPVLYHDADLMIVNKPAGLLVHRGWGRDAVTALTAARARAGAWVYPVHRLDRATSGALAFALSSSMARALGGQFQGNSVQKRYWALVRGLCPETAVVDHPLAATRGAEKRSALTRVRRLARFPVHDEQVGAWRFYSAVEARPESGRLHQIRRHLRHLSHPIIGDVRYGKSQHNRLFRRRFGLERMALHAAELRLLHPRSGASLRVHAPLPRELQSLWEELTGLDHGREMSGGATQAPPRAPLPA